MCACVRVCVAKLEKDRSLTIGLLMKFESIIHVLLYYFSRGLRGEARARLRLEHEDLGIQQRGVQWMGVALWNETVHDMM